MDRSPAGTPASSPVRHAALRRLLTCLVLVVPAIVALTTCDPSPFGTREARGTALDGGMQSEVDAGYDYAQIGQEYWVSLPQTANLSGKPLTLLSATLAPTPKGVRILEYRAVSGNDTDGHLVGAARIGAEGGQLERARNYAGHPIVVKPHHVSDIYYMARIKVTGPIHGELATCRFRYRQGSDTYRQDLRCVTEIKVGTPPR